MTKMVWSQDGHIKRRLLYYNTATFEANQITEEFTLWVKRTAHQSKFIIQKKISTKICWHLSQNPMFYTHNIGAASPFS